MHSDVAIAQKRVAEIPLEANGALVNLRDFCELGLQVNLRRRDVERVDGRLDDVEILQRSANEKDAFTVVEEQGFWWRKINARRREE